MRQGLAAAVPVSGSWTDISGGAQPIALTANTRYVVQISVLATLNWAASDVSSFFAKGYMPAGQLLAMPPGGVLWTVEQVIPGSTNTTWSVIGSPQSNGWVTLATGAYTGTPQNADVIGIWQDSSSSAIVPQPQQPVTPALPAPVVQPPPQPVSYGSYSKGIVGGILLAVAGGIAWDWWKKKRASAPALSGRGR